MSLHHSDQMSQRSQVSGVTLLLCFSKGRSLTQWVTHWPSDKVTYWAVGWTAKNSPTLCLLDLKIYSLIVHNTIQRLWRNLWEKTYKISFWIDLKGCLGLDRNSNEKKIYSLIVQNTIQRLWRNLWEKTYKISFLIDLKGCFGLDRNSNEKAFYPYKEAAMLLIKISISKFLRERSGILIIILIHSITISMMMMRVMKISLMKMRVGNERLMESDIAKRYCQPMQPSSLSTSSSTSSSSSSSSSPSSSCDKSKASWISTSHVLNTWGNELLLLLQSCPSPWWSSWSPWSWSWWSWSSSSRPILWWRWPQRSKNLVTGAKDRAGGIRNYLNPFFIIIIIVAIIIITTIIILSWN